MHYQLNSKTAYTYMEAGNFRRAAASYTKAANIYSLAGKHTEAKQAHYDAANAYKQAGDPIGEKTSLDAAKKNNLSLPNS